MTVKEIQSVIKSCQIPQGQDIKEDLSFILVRRQRWRHLQMKVYTLLEVIQSENETHDTVYH